MSLHRFPLRQFTTDSATWDGVTGYSRTFDPIRVAYDLFMHEIDDPHAPPITHQSTS